MCATYDIGLKFVSEGGLRGREIVEPVPYALSKTPRDLSPSSSTGSVMSSHSTDVTPPSTPDSAHMETPFHILFLGSSLGNFDRAGGSAFLLSLPLRAGSGDTLLLGLDHDNDPKKIEVAYNDPAGHTRNFIMNGLKAAGQTLGNATMFDQEKWDYVSLYNNEKRK
jgi:L-histidine Nalpha-methyltransferase / hercynylcysteine S-oxide synthase